MIAIWTTLAGAGSAYVAAKFRAGDRAAFLPGKTTDGHYQIELACASCHTPFMGVKQDACVECHGAELEAAEDSHPESKFADPRNADRVAKLDARRCVVCHVEHRPETTRATGVTVPDDFCRLCHADIAEVRSSHADVEFHTCSTSGCHNFHDNRALYEDFLLKHADEPDTLATPRLPPRLVAAIVRAPGASAPDAPDRVEPAILADWSASDHSAAGVNCSGCHGGAGTGRAWTDAVSLDTCRECHESQSEGFLAGRHGMRIAAGLSPMSPATARLPMRDDAAHRELTCNSCHPAHRYDLRAAAVRSCQGCHADAHTLAYEGSPHAALLESEIAGAGETGSGVSCATCHLPRIETDGPNGEPRVSVRHNQNENLRPSEKMAREVCMNCHGLGFALDALADPALVANNFSAAPAARIPSIDWALRRAAESERKKGRVAPQ